MSHQRRYPTTKPSLRLASRAISYPTLRFRLVEDIKKMKKVETSNSTVSSVSSSRNGTADESSSMHPLLTVTATRLGPRCPFGNDKIEFSLRRDGCVCLSGSSGRGKTSIALCLAGLQNLKRLEKRLDLKVSCQWTGDFPVSERCGVLLQQTTLVDELTVASNLGLALQKQEPHLDRTTRDNRIKELLTLVGLEATRDGGKRPHQLSGGMARRASLALQLAQHKHVIVLDEPFTGLDEESAESVAAALVNLRRTHGTALLLISHQPHLVERVMDANNMKDNQTIHLEEPTKTKVDVSANWRVHGVSWTDRFTARLWDYFVYSLPLIALAFLAAGMALAMLTADVLQRLDVTDPVVRLVDTEVRPLIKMLTGEEPGTFTMWGVRAKVKSMLNATVPVAKASLYAIGMTRLLVLEMGPLLTALLLCGRIGGSYAGRVATLGATRQDALLQTLGVSVVAWTLGPSLAAASLAAPALTVIGTWVALLCAAWMGSFYGLLPYGEFYRQAVNTCFPVLRLRLTESLIKLIKSSNADMESCAAGSQENTETGPGDSCTEPVAESMSWNDLVWDLRPTFSDSYMDSLVEILTHPAIYHLVKGVVLSLGIVIIADICGRRPLTPRLVPLVITAAVVLDGLWVLIADWGFSQLWLRRYPTDVEWNFRSS